MYEFRLAETEAERRAVYRLRYDVYVEEMGRYQQTADHENRLLQEPEDAHSRIWYARDAEGEAVATARLTWGGDAPFSQRMTDQYGLDRFLAELPAETMAVGERGMVARQLRGSTLFSDMGQVTRVFMREKRIQLIFGACEPHLLSLYLGQGNRTYSDRNINSPEAGYLIPIVMVTEDIAYLRSINATSLEFVEELGDDARVPECVDRLISGHGAVTSPRLTSSEAYWNKVHGALSELADNRITAFDGLNEDEAERCLGKSNIIECGAGDRVLKKGGVARNIFVVLDGTLEVRDGETVVAVLSPGDVFGEMAFLLERPRSRDVYAATDGVRVLSLSEKTIRAMIETDAAIAAHLLLNISKMLCARLLKST